MQDRAQDARGQEDRTGGDRGDRQGATDNRQALEVPAKVLRALARGCAEFTGRDAIGRGLCLRRAGMRRSVFEATDGRALFTYSVPLPQVTVPKDPGLPDGPQHEVPAEPWPDGLDPVVVPQAFLLRLRSKDTVRLLEDEAEVVPEVPRERDDRPEQPDPIRCGLPAVYVPHPTDPPAEIPRVGDQEFPAGPWPTSADVRHRARCHEEYGHVWYSPALLHKVFGILKDMGFEQCRLSIPRNPTSPCRIVAREGGSGAWAGEHTEEAAYLEANVMPMADPGCMQREDVATETPMDSAP